MDSKKISPRRFLRFGLRTFLVAVTVICIWVGTVKNQADKQTEVVAMVGQINGYCRYDFQFDDHGKFDPNGESSVPQYLLDLLGVDFFHDVVEVNFYQAKSTNYLFAMDSGSFRMVDREWRIFDPARQEIAARIIDEIQTLESLRIIGLRAMDDMDSVFEELSKLNQLERITVLKGGDLSDQGMASLGNLRNLKYFSIEDTKIGDPSLEILGTLKNLKTLYLNGHYFSDEGVMCLGNLEKLEMLCIDGPPTGKRSLLALYKTIRQQTSDVTDEGLRELLKLKKLTRLSIHRTSGSKELVAEFQKSIPGCTVSR